MKKLLSAVLLAVCSMSAAQTAKPPVANNIGLELLPGEYVVCRLDKNATIPDWASTAVPVSITRSPAALSIIARASVVPPGVSCARGWRMFEVGFNPPEVSGVVEGFARPLANEHISIHWISSSPTDYLMVEQQNLEAAIRALSAAGHPIRR